MSPFLSRRAFFFIKFRFVLTVLKVWQILRGELRITSSDDVAFCHSLNHIHGTRKGGEHTDVGCGRLLVCASWAANG
jgi:ketosteroid isomerase-like protein